MFLLTYFGNTLSKYPIFDDVQPVCYNLRHTKITTKGGIEMILLTGGHGLLGNELRRLRDYFAPNSQEMDITDKTRVFDVVKNTKPNFVLHCAAYTDVAQAETDWQRCYKVNAFGTRNVAEAAKSIGATLIYMSTDYVFDGEQSQTSPGYKPDDIPHPINWYATTKLIGEIYTQLCPDYYIIRTSFKRSPWKHPKAVIDMWTSGDYVDIIAPLIDKAIGKIVDGEIMPCRILHIGTGRKTLFELAQRRTPNVEAVTRAEIGVRLPKDTTLACSDL